jgi:hypothetical protein
MSLDRTVSISFIYSMFRCLHIRHGLFQWVIPSVLLGLFLNVLLLAISPELHGFFHKDADHEEHSCASTLLLSGNNDVAAATTQLVFLPIAQIFCHQRPTSTFLSSLFLTCRIAEHAPPVVS